MKQTGGLALARQLHREGVTDIFSIPGLQLDWAYDGLRQHRNDIRLFVPRHEQTTSYMADGYARSTGRVGTCMIVPGPGVLNAMAGLSTAYACNSRVLCIAGDIHSSALGKGLGLLHEVKDQTEILAKVTKWQRHAQGPTDIPAVVRDAFHQLGRGKPAPVSIEICHDHLSTEAEIALLDPAPASLPPAPSAAAIERAAAMLQSAAFPLIFVGGGALAANAGKAIAELAEKLDCPVVLGENGRGAVSDRHPLSLNTLGARAVFPHADVVLVVGSRFVETVFGKPTWPTDKAKYIYLNIDPEASLLPRRADVNLQSDARLGVEALIGAVKRNHVNMADRLKRVREWTEKQIALVEPQASYVRALRAAIPDDGFLVNELTQVGYMSRFMYPVYEPNTFLSAGYQGTLGYGFPTALGVAAGNPGKVVVSMTGDGGFGWSLQELATARRYNLDVIVVVFADGYFGNVRTLQKDQFGEEYESRLCNPDFGLLAKSFGVAFDRADSPAALEKSIKSAAAARGPHLIEVPLGEMPSPWHLVRVQKLPFAKEPQPAPPNPLGEPA